jgi:hypothetical protein
MTVLLPRLDREQTTLQIDLARPLTVEEIATRMPVEDVRTTASALGGLEVSRETRADLRLAIIGLAKEHNYPKVGVRLPLFDGVCARLLHERLDISPHEASEDDAWSYLTCCWLLDVAVWRWGGIGDSERRFRGDVNRNTFRRLWWRAEVLGPDVDLTRLGEDELVNIMERPTIASNRPLARALAAAFLARVEIGDDQARMTLMREAGKRLVRLTPIIDFHSLDQVELSTVVRDVLDASANGGPLPAAEPVGSLVEASAGVERLVRPPVLDPQASDDSQVSADATADLEELFEVALAIARGTGRVTNGALREVAPIDHFDARRVLQALVQQGSLVTRGKAKGTYYVLPDEDPSTPSDDAITPQRIATQTPLRRYLRRRAQ